MAKKKKVLAKDIEWVLPVKAEVIVEKWGTLKKGDIIKSMPASTAKACVAHGKIKILGDVPNPNAK